MVSVSQSRAGGGGGQPNEAMAPETKGGRMPIEVTKPNDISRVIVGEQSWRSASRSEPIDHHPKGLRRSSLRSS